MLVQRKVPLTSGDMGQDGVWVWRLSMRGDTWGPFNHTGNFSRKIDIVRKNKIEMLEIENTVTELCASKRAHQETWQSWGKNLNLKIGPEKYIHWNAKRRKSEKKWTEHPKAVWQRKSVRNGEKRKAQCIFLIFHCSTRSRTVENTNDHDELDAYSACGCGMLITMATDTGGRNWENEVLPHTGSSVILFVVDSHY